VFIVNESDNLRDRKRHDSDGSDGNVLGRCKQL
jgi:hypothetical protein